MATAQELFSLTNSTEEHIVVGADRYITVPEPLKRIAVQFDHDVETVTFDCPRYWDDIDMSTMTVYINYKLPNGDLDAYPAKNIKADGDIMHFDWTISNKVTQYKGNLTFLVCVKKTGTDGVEVNHWNSELCTDMYISEGMECEEQTQLEYSDLITQLLERMTVVEQINVQADEMREMHDEVFDETTGVRQTSANAIKGTASGELIQIDDVSPVEHNVKTKVSGKNLWNNLAFRVAEPTNSMYISNVTANAITLTSVEGYVGNGHHPTDITLRQVCPQICVGKTYILQADSAAYIQSIYLKEIQMYWNFNAPLTITKEMLDCTVGIYGLSTMREQGVGDCVISNIQIEEGDTATEYEPYIDPTTVTVTGCGKNIVDILTASINYKFSGGGGIGSEVVFNYSETNISFRKILVRPNTKYTFSLDNSVYWLDRMCEMDGADLLTHHYPFYSSSTDVSEYTFTTKATTEYLVVRFVNKNGAKATLEDLQKTNFQIELGDTPTEYEPFKGGTYTPNADGSVDIKSVSPFMQIFTDTPGVTLDCEYNKDTIKVVDSKAEETIYRFNIAELSNTAILNSDLKVLNFEIMDNYFNAKPVMDIDYAIYTALQNTTTGDTTTLVDIPAQYDNYIEVLGNSFNNVYDYSEPDICNKAVLGNMPIKLSFIGEELVNAEYCTGHSVHVYSYSSTRLVGYKAIGLKIGMRLSFASETHRTAVRNQFIDPIFATNTHIGITYKKPAPIVDCGYVGP